MRFWEKDTFLMQTDYLEENEQLEKIDGMESWLYRLQGPATIKELKQFEKFINRTIPPAMKAFYEKTCGINILFDYHKPENSMYIVGDGGIQTPATFVNGISRCSGKIKQGERLKHLLWDEGDDPAFIKELEENYFILDCIGIICYTFTLFKFVAGKDEPELYLFKYPCYFYPLILSFSDYMELAHEVKMVCGWQNYFIDKARCDKKALLHLEQERPYPFFSELKKVFPGADLSKFSAHAQIQECPLSFSKRAAKKDYYRRFQALAQLLAEKTQKAGGSFKQSALSGYKLDIHTIRKIETILGRSLPDSMLAFYCQLNGFNLSWKYPSSGKYPTVAGYTPGADFKLLPLAKVFGGFEEGVRHWHNQMFEGVVTMEGVQSEEELAFAKQCRLICSEESNDTVIRFVEGQEEPELYVIVKSKFIKINLDFSGFVENLLENMGLEYWQRFFTDEKDYPAENFASLPPVPEFVADIFPDVELAKYRKF